MTDQVLLQPRNGRWYTAEETARIDALLAASFYLIRNDGPGGRARCRRCKGAHAYMTKMCREVPFSQAQVRTNYLSARITTSDRPNAVKDAVGSVLRRPPDLARAHPLYARELAGRFKRELSLAEKERPEHWVAFLLGTAEPITAKRAQELADDIRARGARDFTLQPLAAVRAAAPYLLEVQRHA